VANYNNIKPITLKWEGGLSRNTKDNASKYPSPYIYQGKKGWHTNKGITYQTFEAGARSFGFENNATNFFKMPSQIWDKIAKGFFWDKYNLDNLNSDGLALQIFSWSWGAGTGWHPRMQRYLKSKGIDWNRTPNTLHQALNILLRYQGEKQTINEIQEQQNQFYQSLNQPSFTTGWLNRVKDTTAQALTYIKDIINPAQDDDEKKKYRKIGILILSIGVLYAITKGLKSKK